MKRVRFLFQAILVVLAALVVAMAATFAHNHLQLNNISEASDKTHSGKKDTLSSRFSSTVLNSSFLSTANKATTTAQPLTENIYRQKLSEIISPLLNFNLPEKDKAALNAALKALRKGDLAGARRNGEKISMQIGRKFIIWSILRSGYGRPQQYREFLAQNPLWPDRRLLQRRLEQSLFIDGGSARNILEQFKDNPPQTDAGYAAIASAHLALGDRIKAKRYATQAWCGGGLAARREKYFLKRFKGLLSNADHTCRLNRLLVANLRWRTSRKSRAHAIRRVIKLLDKKDQKKATARLAAFLRQPIATKWMNAVPAKQRKNDHGYAFQHIQHLRRARKHNAAWKLLAKVPTASNKLMNIDAWWEERHANALNAIKLHEYKLAARLVNDIRPEGLNAAKDQAFFAGWLALRKQANPTAALAHFKRFLKFVDGPLSSSKGHYWLAQTYAALNQDNNARDHYKAGTQYRDTFHGLLAAQSINPENQQLELPLPTLPSEQDIDAFLNSDAVQAAVVAYRLGRPRSQIMKFFRSLAKHLESEAQVAMLAQLSAVLGDGQLEVRVGKAGVARGFNTYIFSYPLNYLPKYEPLRKPPERAVVLAIGRQESEFNTRVVSGAGARGMLQVMPITARHICRQYKIKCQLKNLLEQPNYNLRIATAYIADRTDEFGGSYILTFTGYNAGPGRTRQWLRQIGDPRNPKLKPLDWIYQIPFTETRLYAQKVLSNVQVYRARLGVKNPLRLISDMHRGRRQ